MPIAVFYTETKKQAIKLFARLYRKSWAELVRDDRVIVLKEKDVPAEEWVRMASPQEEEIYSLPEPRTIPDSWLMECAVIKSLRPLVTN
jgi:hypothetical protein